MTPADRARIRAHAERLAADAPPLTGARRERVRSLLRGSGSNAHDTGAGHPGRTTRGPGARVRRTGREPAA